VATSPANCGSIARLLCRELAVAPPTPRIAANKRAGLSPRLASRGSYARCARRE